VPLVTSIFLTKISSVVRGQLSSQTVIAAFDWKHILPLTMFRVQEYCKCDEKSGACRTRVSTLKSCYIQLSVILEFSKSTVMCCEKMTMTG